MPDEGRAGRGVVGKEPGVAVGAAMELLHTALVGAARGVLPPIRRDDEVSGLAQSGDDPRS
jgi:hypothetical protein